MYRRRNAAVHTCGSRSSGPMNIAIAPASNPGWASIRRRMRGAVGGPLRRSGELDGLQLGDEAHPPQPLGSLRTVVSQGTWGARPPRRLRAAPRGPAGRGAGRARRTRRVRSESAAVGSAPHGLRPWSTAPRNAPALRSSRRAAGATWTRWSTRSASPHKPPTSATGTSNSTVAVAPGATPLCQHRVRQHRAPY
jgi:hypothetical protein